MGKIVCATRGGEGSRAVQMAAIDRADNTGNPLIFFYVTDPTALVGMEDTLRDAVRAELEWMGQTLLEIARQRAHAADLEANVVIRHGEVRAEIGRFLREHDVTLLLLGAPRGTTANVFGDDAIEQFALHLHNETGVQVEVIRPEDG